MKQNTLVSIVNRRKIVDLVDLKMYTSFLKRTRKKLNINQDVISDGICTVSYYSRIENNQVTCDEEYLVRFFEKLNIDFYALRESKNCSIFEDLVKSYLNCDLDDIFETIEDASSSKFYADEELSLLLLFHDVLDNSLASAGLQIEKLGEELNVFDETEQTFYLFAEALFYFKSRNIDKTVKIINKILTKELCHEAIRYAAICLMLDVRIYLNDIGSFNYYYNALAKTNFFTFYQQFGLKHQAQKMFVECNANNYKETIKNIALIHGNVRNRDISCYVTYLIVKCSMQNNDFYKAYETFKTIKKVDGLYILYLGYIAYYTKDKTMLEEFNRLYDSYTFLVTEKNYHKACSALRYCLLKDFNSASTILKEILSSSEINSFEMIITLLNIRLLMDVSLETGRYKETVLLIRPLLGLNSTITK